MDFIDVTSDVSKQLKANPKAEICGFMDGKWVRISCKLISDDRLEPKVAMLDKYPHLKAMYDPNDENTEVLYIADAVATFSSFTEAPKVVKF